MAESCRITQISTSVRIFARDEHALFLNHRRTAPSYLLHENCLYVFGGGFFDSIPVRCCPILRSLESAPPANSSSFLYFLWFLLLFRFAAAGGFFGERACLLRPSTCVSGLGMSAVCWKRCLSCQSARAVQTRKRVRRWPSSTRIQARFHQPFFEELDVERDAAVSRE